LFRHEAFKILYTHRLASACMVAQSFLAVVERGRAWMHWA